MDSYKLISFICNDYFSRSDISDHSLQFIWIYKKHSRLFAFSFAFNEYTRLLNYSGVFLDMTFIMRRLHYALR